MSETVIKLNAICINCKSEAAFTARISNETTEVVVGAEDKYVAVCRQCKGPSDRMRSADTLLALPTMSHTRDPTFGKRNLDSLRSKHFFSSNPKDLSNTNDAVVTSRSES